MLDGIEIRESRAADMASLEKLYPDAFPDEDLLPLVQALLSEESVTLSLVAMADRTAAGHVIFTLCGLAGSADKVALLGPLAVASDRQRRGIGSALVRAGLERLRAVSAIRVYVLGDPAYYGRFGFAPDDSVAPPYALPEEWRGAWQSIPLSDDRLPLRGPPIRKVRWVSPSTPGEKP